MHKPHWNESSTVHSFDEGPPTPKRQVTGMNRTKPIDPFIQFLLDNSPICKGLSLYEAAKKIGMSNQTLYAYANRGIRDFDIMADLAAAFQVDIEVFTSYIYERVAGRYSEKPHTKISA